MNIKDQKIIINIQDKKNLNWKLLFEQELKNTRSNILEIDCNNIELSCADILEITNIATKYECTIIGFCSTSYKTIISAQSLGYRSQLIIQNRSKNILKTNNQNFNVPLTHFHQGTVRSGEYLDIDGDLLILGDVNPGAVVSAEDNIVIWGRLLGIAHAGSKGNTKATISALQLKPVQLRIANKVARGPKEKSKFGLAEQAKIVNEKILIFPLDSI